MVVWTLILYLVYCSLALFGRAYIQKIKTGSFGINRFGARKFSAEWIANMLVGSGAFLGFLAVLMELAKVTQPITRLISDIGHIAGFVLFAIGLTLMFHSQLVMGNSWRVGVAHDEKTDLVTHGIYSMVRNPIYTAGSLVSLSLIFILPDPLLIVSFVIQSLGLHLQVKNVEEPYLLKIHRERFTEYLASTGRFLPRIRRIKMATDRHAHPRL